MELMTALELGPRPIPIVDDDLEANGARHRPPSAVAVVDRHVVVALQPHNLSLEGADKKKQNPPTDRPTNQPTQPNNLTERRSFPERGGGGGRGKP